MFFAFSGLNTHLDGLGTALLLPFGAVVVAAFAGKFLGCGLTTRCYGLSWRHAGAVGALMNARGLMILVFINIGLAEGLISAQVFSMLVLVAVLTTAVAMPLYRLSFPAWMERLERRPQPVPVPSPPAAGGGPAHPARQGQDHPSEADRLPTSMRSTTGVGPMSQRQEENR
jgi:Kef-type K+ transport system membrane component KefB